MGYRKPDRRTVVDREFPVRLTIASLSDPAELEATRRWLERFVGSFNYGTTPGLVWSRKAIHVHFRDVHAATMFLAGNPQVRLLGERYEGPPR